MTKKSHECTVLHEWEQLSLIVVDDKFYWVDVYKKEIQLANLPVNSPSLVEIAKPVSVSPSVDGKKKPNLNIVIATRKDNI